MCLYLVYQTLNVMFSVVIGECSANVHPYIVDFHNDNLNTILGIKRTRVITPLDDYFSLCTHFL